MGEENEVPEVENPGLSYDDALDEIPVKVKGKDKRVREYILKQMEGDDLTKWMTIVSGRVKMKKGAPTGEMDLTKFHASLICLCLWDPETGKKVPKDTIASWKAEIQNDLFRRCRKMNGLDDESAEEAKNG